MCKFYIECRNSDKIKPRLVAWKSDEPKGNANYTADTRDELAKKMGIDARHIPYFGLPRSVSRYNCVISV